MSNVITSTGVLNRFSVKQKGPMPVTDIAPTRDDIEDGVQESSVKIDEGHYEDISIAKGKPNDDTHAALSRNSDHYQIWHNQFLFKWKGSKGRNNNGVNIVFTNLNGIRLYKQKGGDILEDRASMEEILDDIECCGRAKFPLTMNNFFDHGNLAIYKWGKLRVLNNGPKDFYQGNLVMWNFDLLLWYKVDTLVEAWNKYLKDSDRVDFWIEPYEADLNFQLDASDKLKALKLSDVKNQDTSEKPLQDKIYIEIAKFIDSYKDTGKKVNEFPNKDMFMDFELLNVKMDKLKGRKESRVIGVAMSGGRPGETFEMCLRLI